MDMQSVTNLIGQYGMIAVCALIALEYACFPVPSEIVLPFAGAYAARRGLPFAEVLALSVAAGLTGSAVCYLIGFFGAATFLPRLGRRFRKLGKGLDDAARWFTRFGGVSVAVARVLPLCRTYISFAAGLSKQNIFAFLAFSAIGITGWNAVLVGLGYQLAENWGVISVWAKKYSCILLPFVLVAVFVIACRIKNKAGSK